MSSFNKVILMGHLCRDWELRYLPKGTAVAENSIAVNRQWQSESGEKKEEVAFVPLKAWARTAEALGQYTRKGDPLLIEGRIVQEIWEDKTTHQQRSALKVVLESFSFIKQKADGSAQAAPRPAPAQQQPGSAPPPEEDAIPF